MQSLRRKNNQKSKIKHFPCDHSSYLEQRDVRDIRESTFFKKVSVTTIFSENILYRLEMDVLEEDPVDGDQDV